jgi:penicillin-binding protein 1B
MTVKSSARKSGSKTTPARGRRIGPSLGSGLLGLFTLFLGGALLVGGVALGLYMNELDKVIQTQFAGKRWALPARVYARPLQLFPGARLSAEEFAAELDLLPYRATERLPNRPGSFRRNGQQFDLYTRNFSFWDGIEPARLIQLEFADGQLNALRSLDNQPDPTLLRLEPVEIAGIYPSHGEDRILTRYHDLPPVLIDALMAVEDRAFYEHMGVDLRGITRAFIANLRAGRTVQGGSTLTQQLVKNFFLTNERSLERKINEALMAILVEWRYDKSSILEAYANEIYLGQDGSRAIHGFGLASRFYFDRTLNELDLHHVALLVGLIRAPSHYNPRRFPERAQARRAVVLDVMVDQYLISAEAAEIAKQMPLGVTQEVPRGRGRYPAFLDLVRRHLQENYHDDDLTSEGLRVFTTIDPRLQDAAEQALVNRLEQLDERARGGNLEAAAITVDIRTGEVVSMVGGRDPRMEGFNRVLDAQRQPGSVIKPFIYLAALEFPASYTLATLISDEPLTYRPDRGPVWEPKNYNNRHHGWVPLQESLARSYNVATARLGLNVDVTRVIQMLQRLGLNKPLQPYPSLLLGAIDLSPLEVAQLYVALASGGYQMPLRTITEVASAEGQPLPRLYSLSLEKVIDTGPAYLINQALQRAVRSGTGAAIHRAMPSMNIAGKTGTTNDHRDSWFAGYSGNLLTVVWVGRDDNQPTGLSGSNGALPVWLDIMQHMPLTPVHMPLPDEVHRVLIDPESGRLADEQCSGAQWVPFIQGSEPYDWAPCSSYYYTQRFEPVEVYDDADDTVDSFFRRLLP